MTTQAPSSSTSTTPVLPPNAEGTSFDTSSPLYLVRTLSTNESLSVSQIEQLLGHWQVYYDYLVSDVTSNVISNVWWKEVGSRVLRAEQHFKPLNPTEDIVIRSMRCDSRLHARIMLDDLFASITVDGVVSIVVQWIEAMLEAAELAAQQKQTNNVELCLVLLCCVLQSSLKYHHHDYLPRHKSTEKDNSLLTLEKLSQMVTLIEKLFKQFYATTTETSLSIAVYSLAVLHNIVKIMKELKNQVEPAIEDVEEGDTDDEDDKQQVPQVPENEIAATKTQQLLLILQSSLLRHYSTDPPRLYQVLWLMRRCDLDWLSSSKAITNLLEVSGTPSSPQFQPTLLVESIKLFNSCMISRLLTSSHSSKGASKTSSTESESWLIGNREMYESVLAHITQWIVYFSNNIDKQQSTSTTDAFKLFDQCLVQSCHALLLVVFSYQSNTVKTAPSSSQTPLVSNEVLTMFGKVIKAHFDDMEFMSDFLGVLLASMMNGQSIAKLFANSEGIAFFTQLMKDQMDSERCLTLSSSVFRQCYVAMTTKSTTTTVTSIEQSSLALTILSVGSSVLTGSPPSSSLTGNDNEFNVLSRKQLITQLIDVHFFDAFAITLRRYPSNVMIMSALQKPVDLLVREYVNALTVSSEKDYDVVGPLKDELTPYLQNQHYEEFLTPLIEALKWNVITASDGTSDVLSLLLQLIQYMIRDHDMEIREYFHGHNILMDSFEALMKSSKQKGIKGKNNTKREFLIILELMIKLTTINKEYCKHIKYQELLKLSQIEVHSVIDNIVIHKKQLDCFASTNICLYLLDHFDIFSNSIENTKLATMTLLIYSHARPCRLSHEQLDKLLSAMQKQVLSWKIVELSHVLMYCVILNEFLDQKADFKEPISLVASRIVNYVDENAYLSFGDKKEFEKMLDILQVVVGDKANEMKFAEFEARHPDNTKQLFQTVAIVIVVMIGLLGLILVLIGKREDPESIM